MLMSDVPDRMLTRIREKPQQSPAWRQGRFCSRHPAHCGLMERALPELVSRLSRRGPLAGITLRDAFRLSVLSLLRRGAERPLHSADQLRRLVEADLSAALRPLSAPASGPQLARVAAAVSRHTPRCYSVSGAQLRPAWTVYANFAARQPGVTTSLEDFQMRVQIQAAMEAWQQTSFSLPRWIAMLWIDGMRQSLLQKAHCGLRETKAKGKGTGE
ncbi:hypothetical protein FJT64_022307 [Amphibalanus amphitrite]|uniref:Uncharacterized protein n=1 Tax=Amphibalanus amphitrite TaxID=1232801 RepID=A0A6A4WHI4_AMPAM|nr:hypothetical protein FJT64_022307 [Amphibalanus amphitrite]